MPPLREHISCLAPLQLIPHLSQSLHIPCQGSRVTADIHNLLRGHGYHSLQQSAIASLPGRIHYHHIGTVLLQQAGSHILCCPTAERHILKSVQLCIFSGVFHSLRHNLHTYHLSLWHGLGKKERDGTDTAVQIPHRLMALQTGKIQRSGVEFLGLDRIDLIKRFR